MTPHPSPPSSPQLPRSAGEAEPRRAAGGGRSGFDLLAAEEGGAPPEDVRREVAEDSAERQLPPGKSAPAARGRRAHLRPKQGADTDRVDRELFLRGSGRQMAAGRILGAGVICFALWTLFDANQLYHSALSSPEGARRTLSLTITRPIAKLSNLLGLSALVSWGDHMLGRGNGTPGAGAYHFPTPVVLPPPQPQIPLRSNGLTYPEIPNHDSVPPPLPDRLPPLPQPTAAHPLTILAIGDSIGQDLGYGLGDTFTGSRSVKVVEEAVESTGLARPDYYNWPAQLESYLNRYHPGAVVIMLGANDEQALDENGHFVPLGSRAWAQAYTARVALLMNEAYAAGARVLWVGLPPMDSPNVSSGFARQLNGIFKAQASVHPDVTYFSSWSLLSGQGGQFTLYVRVDGAETQIRYPDGVHLTPQGWDLLASAIVKPMERAWGVRLTG